MQDPHSTRVQKYLEENLYLLLTCADSFSCHYSLIVLHNYLHSIHIVSGITWNPEIV
jgi:hypothetical protein